MEGIAVLGSHRPQGGGESLAVASSAPACDGGGQSLAASEAKSDRRGRWDPPPAFGAVGGPGGSGAEAPGMHVGSEPGPGRGVGTAGAAPLFTPRLSGRTEYVDQGQDYYEARYRERVVHQLNQRAAKLGMQRIAIPGAVG